MGHRDNVNMFLTVISVTISMVKPASNLGGPVFNPSPSHISDWNNTGILATNQPNIWLFGVNGRTVLPGVSIPWVAEAVSLICNFYLSVAARPVV